MIKLPNFSQCVQVRQLLVAMGIYNVHPLPIVKFEKTTYLSKDIYEANPESLEFKNDTYNTSKNIENELIQFDTSNIISIKGIKCSIYIKKQKQGYNLANNSSEYRYHLCNCKTIQEMIAKGRKNRYVATSRDDGLFEVNIQEFLSKAKNILLTLELCHNCREILKHNQKYPTPFSLKEFFFRYQSEIPQIFKRTEQIPVTEAYDPNQSEISKKYKEAVSYRCQLCSVDCACNVSLLHLHHKDGDGANNKRENLVVLCVDCHTNQPMHSHMLRNPNFKRDIDSINKLRKEQNIQNLHL